VIVTMDRYSFSVPQGQAQDRMILGNPATPPATPKTAQSDSAGYHGEIMRIAHSRPTSTLKNIPIITMHPNQFLQPGRARWAIARRNTPAHAHPSRQLHVKITHAGLALEPVAALAAAGNSALARPPVLPQGPAHHAHGSPRKWTASAWLFWRGRGRGSAIGNAGQLGGPQAGIRVEHRLATAMGRMPVAAYGRASTALRQPHAPEAALGIAIKPATGQVPVTLGIERRIALDRYGRNAFALVAASGLNPTPVAHKIVAEGYVQAGLVGFSRTDPFIDGRISLGTPLDTGQNLLAGASLSGGAQPHVSRLDIGPMVQWRLPGKTMNSRLTIEWRQRIAGSARPGSGLTATLASDF